jgi:hypothetical protein
MMPMTDSEQWRLRRSVALHGFAVAVFAMLALSGAVAATQRLYGLAVPFIVAGTAGAVGAAVIAATVWRGEAGAAATKTQQTIRLAMAGAAVVVLITGVLLAPQGVDRGFAIWVAALLAGALALFALLAGDQPRPAAQPSGARNPH